MANLIVDTENKLFQLAANLVNQSSRNIFLTGKAGTGKTTFLKYIKENCPKQIAVVAPTGVAAVNASGVTIHSFFQLPLSPFIPGNGRIGELNEAVTNRNSLLSRLRMTNEKRKILQELDLLIIDEISMVRGDTIDAIDTVLRHVRHRANEIFGGVQILLIGDMFQLPPVVKDQEWMLLKDFYNSPYFFDSLALKNEPPICVELTKIYRQSEERFVNVLNQVRNNQLDEEVRTLLEERFSHSAATSGNDGYIILTTHNEKARIKNDTELTRLKGPVFSYKGGAEGDFPQSAYPAEENLQLKVGAQVMFIRNDPEKVKRYFNGKIGTVSELDDEKIMIRCKGELEPIEVRKEKWENIRYSLDKVSRHLSEEVLGSFTQYPLRLAWAITIHKSQGLTFEKVIIDAGDSFAPGQVYVALSRCTTLEGVLLQSHIRPGRLFTDERIVEYLKNISSDQPVEEELRRSRKQYHLKVLSLLFDYREIVARAGELNQYINENLSSFNIEAVGWIHQFKNGIDRLQITAEKFQGQLTSIFHNQADGAGSQLVKDRITAAAIYFLKEQNTVSGLLMSCPVVTDSRLHAKEINEGLKEIFGSLSIKRHLLENFSMNPDIDTYHQKRKEFVFPAFAVNVYAGVAKDRTESLHPQLHQRLRRLRDSICDKTGLPIYLVAGSRTLDELAHYLPQDMTELRQISGFGEAKIKMYGQQFLALVLEYCKDQKLSSLIHEKTPKRERKKANEKKSKVDTKSESFRLYKGGKSVEEIAIERKLTRQTIEGHLAYYVSRGEINIKELVSEEKYVSIEKVVKTFTGGSLTPFKEKLGSAISFGEIRLVIASLGLQNDQRPI